MISESVTEDQHDKFEDAVIQQPIQFYEVNEECDEDQLVQNQAWSQSFEEGHLFSIAEITSGHEETQGATSTKNDGTIKGFQHAI